LTNWSPIPRSASSSSPVGENPSVGLDVFEFFTNYHNALTGATADAWEEFYGLILRMREGLDRMTNGNNIYIAAIHRHSSAPVSPSAPPAICISLREMLSSPSSKPGSPS